MRSLGGMKGLILYSSLRLRKALLAEFLIWLVMFSFRSRVMPSDLTESASVRFPLSASTAFSHSAIWGFSSLFEMRSVSVLSGFSLRWLHDSQFGV